MNSVIIVVQRTVCEKAGKELFNDKTDKSICTSLGRVLELNLLQVHLQESFCLTSLILRV